MVPSLAHQLHVLVARMDRRAEALLAASESRLTYRRFLVLVQVAGLDGPTQRELAEGTGASEAATSRMVAGLAADGLLDVRDGGGRRRSLHLTAEGGRRLTAAGEVLGERFDGLVRDRGHDPTQLHALVTDLADALRED